MKGLRGKKGKYLTCAKKGLLKDHVWKRALKGYPTDLVCSIREQLAKQVPGLTEKFNCGSRYFGYWTGTDKDRLYIFVRKKDLSILLDVSCDCENEIRSDGFEVHYINNFQGRAGWLTGWRVPHTTKNIRSIMKWLLKAFEEYM